MFTDIFSVVSLYITLYQKHALFWNVYSSLCFILHLGKHFCFTCMSNSCNKCCFFSPWSQWLCFRPNERSTQGILAESLFSFLVYLPFWFLLQGICSSSLHGNKSLKRQKGVLTHPKVFQSEELLVVGESTFWTIFWMAFWVSVYESFKEQWLL